MVQEAPLSFGTSISPGLLKKPWPKSGKGNTKNAVSVKKRGFNLFTLTDPYVGEKTPWSFRISKITDYLLVIPKDFTSFFAFQFPAF